MEYSWLHDDMNGRKEKISFKDRTEYRISGKLHNITGPAVIYHSYGLITVDADNCFEFWLKGVKYTKEDWNVFSRKYKIMKIKKKLGK